MPLRVNRAFCDSGVNHHYIMQRKAKNTKKANYYITFCKSEKKLNKRGKKGIYRIHPYRRYSFFFLSALMMLSDFCMRAFS